MAASPRRIASLCFRALMSFEIATIATGTACCPRTGLAVACT